MTILSRSSWFPSKGHALCFLVCTSVPCMWELIYNDTFSKNCPSAGFLKILPMGYHPLVNKIPSLHRKQVVTHSNLFGDYNLLKRSHYCHNSLHRFASLAKSNQSMGASRDAVWSSFGQNERRFPQS